MQTVSITERGSEEVSKIGRNQQKSLEIRESGKDGVLRLSTESVSRRKEQLSLSDGSED